MHVMSPLRLKYGKHFREVHTCALCTRGRACLNIGRRTADRTWGCLVFRRERVIDGGVRYRYKESADERRKE